MNLETFDAIKVLLPAVLAFMVGVGLTPTLTNYMYKHKLWRRTSRSKINTQEVSADFKRIHNELGENSTPRIGGVLVWLSIIVTIALLFTLSWFFPNEITEKLNFLSRNQTLLPLAAFLFASIVGLVDDMIQIQRKDGDPLAGEGLSRAMRVLVVLLIGAVGAWWFYFKLEQLDISIPFYGLLDLGPWFIPFFLFVVLGVFSGSVIDGIDGLGAGVMSAAYGSFMIIAISQNQIDLAAFCAVVVGGLLAFLWFNIPPARFYLGETGMLGLTVGLAIVAFLTKQVILLPIIAFPLFITSVSSSAQMFSKKYFHRKILLVAPLHHHLEAIGWSSYKVTMRYWIIAVVTALLGAIIAIVG